MAFCDVDVDEGKAARDALKAAGYNVEFFEADVSSTCRCHRRSVLCCCKRPWFKPPLRRRCCPPLSVGTISLFRGEVCQGAGCRH